MTNLLAGIWRVSVAGIKTNIDIGVFSKKPQCISQASAIDHFMNVHEMVKKMREVYGENFLPYKKAKIFGNESECVPFTGDCETSNVVLQAIDTVKFTTLRNEINTTEYFLCRVPEEYNERYYFLNELRDSREEKLMQRIPKEADEDTVVCESSLTVLSKLSKIILVNDSDIDDSYTIEEIKV